jgi:hypothetical protein
VRIGSGFDVSSKIKGYVSNVRVVKGTAVYTSAFTPSTTPLTAISGTSLLTCQSNRFIDNSSNNFAITVNGTPSVQRFSPFSPSAAYSTSVIGGSGYFDGVGDSLTFTASSATSFAGDFTIEGWVYLLSYAGSSYNECTFLSLRSGLSTGTCFDWGRSNGASAGAIDWWHNGAAVCAGTAGDIPLNQWAHLAWVRSGSGTNNCKIYVNGALKAQGTNTTTMGISSGTGYIGNSMFDQTMTGYMSNLRISNAAVYTSIFTPPNSPVTGGALLLNYTNAGITDTAMINDLETVGNAQISTSVVKYGSGSMSFNGSSCLTVPNSSLFSLGNGDFTFELWAYVTQQNSNQYYYFFGKRPSTGSQNYLALGVRNNVAVLAFATGTSGAWGSLTFGNISVSLSTWTHFALSRSGSNVNVFVNGVKDTGASIVTSASVVDNTNPFYVGTGTTDVGGEFYVGNIDDLRITRGYARYTANFTPPTQELPGS